ncbi:NAD(P)-dependent oxidoreductase [Peptacetobacter hominis]|uniref:NAD(P)-dependent oxidoreductase n=1 Tax=Peptacetobacter hominis TaxID=2743610 RepID=A0A544QTA8_9FIRM|nr:NAD-dependent epimerase/dehydratase family protein [Peptacetobacter hominis]TQQ83927.1 NAD(P)-dependent oxidoreductase [Peptacetobacter hominis]
MKVLYIGEADVFASVLIKKLVDRKFETGIISYDPFEADFLPKRDNIRMYTGKYHEKNIEGFFSNFAPDIVIFAGSIILDRMSVSGEWGQYMKGLRETLRLCRDSNVKRFVYISSLEVCRKEILHFNLKYEAHKEAERIVDESAREGLNLVKLRMGDVFSRERYCFKGGFMDRIIKDINRQKTAMTNAGQRYFPVSVEDLSNIIVESVYGGFDGYAGSSVFNIVPDRPIDEFNVYMLIADAIKSSHGIARQVYNVSYTFDTDKRYNLMFEEKEPFIKNKAEIKIVKKDYIKGGVLSVITKSLKKKKNK